MTKDEKNMYYSSKLKKKGKEDKVLIGYEQLLNEEDEDDDTSYNYKGQGGDKAWEKIKYQSKDFDKSRLNILSEDYYIRKTPKKQTNVTVSTLENSIEVVNHIIV